MTKNEQKIYDYFKARKGEKVFLDKDYYLIYTGALRLKRINSKWVGFKKQDACIMTIPKDSLGVYFDNENKMFIRLLLEILL